MGSLQGKDIPMCPLVPGSSCNCPALRALLPKGARCVAYDPESGRDNCVICMSGTLATYRKRIARERMCDPIPVVPMDELEDTLYEYLLQQGMLPYPIQFQSTAWCHA